MSFPIHTSELQLVRDGHILLRLKKFSHLFGRASRACSATLLMGVPSFKVFTNSPMTSFSSCVSGGPAQVAMLWLRVPLAFQVMIAT